MNSAMAPYGMICPTDGCFLRLKMMAAQDDRLTACLPVKCCTKKKKQTGSLKPCQTHTFVSSGRLYAGKCTVAGRVVCSRSCSKALEPHASWMMKTTASLAPVAISASVWWVLGVDSEVGAGRASQAGCEMSDTAESHVKQMPWLLVELFS